MARLRHLVRQLTAPWQPSAAQPAIAAGMRAAAATILPVLVGELSGLQVFVWMALGGWLASLSDPGGPYRSRARHQLAFLAAGTVATVAGGLVAEHLIAGPAVLGLGALLCCFARALGDSAGTVGTLVLVQLCVAIGAARPDAPALLARAELFAFGALSATVLSLGLWPFRPYLPVRRAVARCLRLLASHARGLLALAGEPEEAWDSFGRLERAQLRDALERARHLLLTARGLRAGDTPRGEQLLAIYETAELSLGALSAASEALRTLPPDAAEEERRALSALHAAFHAAADAVEGGGTPFDASALQRSRAVLRHGALPGDLRSILRGLLGQGLYALELSSALREGRASPQPLRGLPPPPPPPRPLAQLRAELTLRSPVLRHAARVAVATVGAELLALGLRLPRAHWVTFTVVIVLQPQSGASFRRGVQRVLGTVLGATLAALIGAVAPGPLALAVILFPLTAAAVAIMPVNYGLYSTLLTPVFVLMSESLGGDWHLTRLRIVNTMLGGAVALLSAALLWPSWEVQRRPALIERLLGAARAYLRAVISRAAQGELLAARRELGLAAAQMEASLQRSLSEPAASEAELEPVLALVAVARRFAGTATLLREALQLSPPSGEAQATAAALDAVLGDLAQAAAEGRPPALFPPLPEPPPVEPKPGHELDFDAHPQAGAAGPAAVPAGYLQRLSRQTLLLHGAVARLAAASASPARSPAAGAQTS